jgi:hypothetical protein
MKRIQMLKAAIVVVAIGGAFASKASTRQVVTRFTLNGTAPCNTPGRLCEGTGKICRDIVGSNVKTYYHQAGSNPCGQVLMEHL